MVPSDHGVLLLFRNTLLCLIINTTDSVVPRLRGSIYLFARIFFAYQVFVADSFPGMHDAHQCLGVRLHLFNDVPCFPLLVVGTDVLRAQKSSPFHCLRLARYPSVLQWSHFYQYLPLLMVGSLFRRLLEKQAEVG